MDRLNRLLLAAACLVFLLGITPCFANPVARITPQALWHYSLLPFDLFPTWNTSSVDPFDEDHAQWSVGQAAFSKLNPVYPGYPYNFPGGNTH